MMKNYVAIALCTLAISACSDRGEAERAEIIQAQILGENNDTDGINGQVQADGETVVDDDTAVVPAENPVENSDSGDSPAVLPETPTTTPGDGSESASGGDTTNSTSDDNSSGEGEVTETPVATSGGRVLLPPDCEIVDGDAGRSYCVSASAGNRLFALNADETLRWTTLLPAIGSNVAPVIVPGDELFLLRPDNNGTVSLVSLDASGNTRYEALLTGDFNTIVAGLFDQPHLFLHVKNAAGNSSLLQLDAATGRQNRILNFTGNNLDSLSIEEFNGTRVLAVTLDGVTNYLTLDEMLTFNRVFALDPTNFQENFPVQMGNLRGQYLNQYVSLLRNAINLVDTDSLETEVACPGAGSINLLPQNSFVSQMQFTRAYEFVDCDINGTVANGSIVHTLFELETVGGRNVNESLQTDNLSVSRETEGAEAGQIFVEARTISATLNNVYIFSGDNLSSERTLDVESYNHTFGDASVIAIEDANYIRQITTQGEGVPGGGFRLTEAGSMQSVSDRDGTVDVQIAQPLVYLNSDAPTSSASLADAPLSGIVELVATDSSTLRVDAGRAGANQQNYLLTQRGTEITVDDIWMVQPIDTTLNIFD